MRFLACCFHISTLVVLKTDTFNSLPGGWIETNHRGTPDYDETYDYYPPESRMKSQTPESSANASERVPSPSGLSSFASVSNYLRSMTRWGRTIRTKLDSDSISGDGYEDAQANPQSLLQGALVNVASDPRLSSEGRFEDAMSDAQSTSPSLESEYPDDKIWLTRYEDPYISRRKVWDVFRVTGHG